MFPEDRAVTVANSLPLKFWGPVAYNFGDQIHNTEQNIHKLSRAECPPAAEQLPGGRGHAQALSFSVLRISEFYENNTIGLRHINQSWLDFGSEPFKG